MLYWSAHTACVMTWLFVRRIWGFNSFFVLVNALTLCAVYSLLERAPYSLVCMLLHFFSHTWTICRRPRPASRMGEWLPSSMQPNWKKTIVGGPRLFHIVLIHVQDGPIVFQSHFNLPLWQGASLRLQHRGCTETFEEIRYINTSSEQSPNLYFL